MRAKTIQVECLGSTQATYFLNHGMSLTIAWQGRLRVIVGQQGHGTALASGTILAWPLIHSMNSLLAHGLTVKLSQSPCSHSSLAGRIAACLCGHSKCNLLLAQARPRMIQHLTSTSPRVGRVSCSTVLSCWRALSLVCNTFPDYTGLKVNFWTLHI